MTTLSTAVGAGLLAHGLHYAMVLAGLWGLGALLLPHVLDRYADAADATGPRDEHDVRVSVLRATLAAGALGSPSWPYDIRTAPSSNSLSTLSPALSLAPSPTPARPSVAATLGLPLALVGTAAAAGIHAAVTPPHLSESVLLGAFFLVVALVQMAWAVILLQRPSIGLLHVGVLLNLGLIALWLVTRTLGLPFGLLPTAHPVGGWDVACVAWEAMVVAACLHALRHGVPSRFPGWFSWHPTSRAAVGAASMSLVLLTVLGAHS